MVQCVCPDWRVRDATPLDGGTDAVLAVTADTDDDRSGPREFALKACTAVPPEDFRPEPVLLALLDRRTAVPVPRVVGAVDDHDDLPAPFFLMERSGGVLADDADLSSDAVERVARAAGRYAGEYHALADFERFGFLRVDRDLAHDRPRVTVDDHRLAVADGAARTWRAYVEDLYRNWITDLDDRFADLRPRLESFVESRLDALDRSFDAVLGHVDYKYWNLLVRPETGETTAVLDWAHATAMAPYYDLLLTEDHLSGWAPLDSPRRTRVRAAIEDGYAETNTLDRTGDFDERRALSLAVSRLQPLVHFSEWTADVPHAERAERARRHRQFVEDLLP